MKKITCSISLIWLCCLGFPSHASDLPPSFQETEIVTGLTAPTAMDFAPDGRLFVCEQNGQLRIVKNEQLLGTPFLTVSVTSNSERGLLGVAFDPDFSSNGWVYIYYTRATPPVKNRISRFTTSSGNPDIADPNSEVVILDDIASDAGNHNGGAIHFGLDGMLYAGVGDGGATPTNSQNLGNLSGKLLRIDASNYPNIIPPDNPFVGVPGAREEIWVYGLRNPYTFAVQPGTGKIHINDVGSTQWEEINLSVKGENYGWPVVEGIANDPRFEDPIYAYPHGNSAAITGGAFYQASQFPAQYQGDYFFADYLMGFIKVLNPNNQAEDFGTNVPGPVDLKVGPDGSLYYLSIFNGSVFKISYVSAPITITVIPQNPPINIPPGGGSFSFDATLTNISGSSETRDVWNLITAPNGNTFTTIGPTTLTLPSGFSGMKTLSQQIPGGAPAGQYTYAFNVGTHPNTIESSDSFTFTKSVSPSALQKSEPIETADWTVLDAQTALPVNFEEWNAVAIETATPDESIPQEFALQQNYPNPFNPRTTISFSLPETSNITLAIYNLRGQLVRSLHSGAMAAGHHRVAWDGTDARGVKVASGVYLYRLEARVGAGNSGEHFVAANKLVLMK